MAYTEGYQTARWKKSYKTGLSSDCSLQLDYMKSESLVIADQHAAVNTFPGLVHTARHAMEAGSAQRRRLNPERKQWERSVEGKVGDWGEVVTR